MLKVCWRLLNIFIHARSHPIFCLFSLSCAMCWCEQFLNNTSVVSVAWSRDRVCNDAAAQSQRRRFPAGTIKSWSLLLGSSASSKTKTLHLMWNDDRFFDWDYFSFFSPPLYFCGFHLFGCENETRGCEDKKETVNELNYSGQDWWDDDFFSATCESGKLIIITARGRKAPFFFGVTH